MIYTTPAPPVRAGDNTADLAALYEWCAAARRQLREGLFSVEPEKTASDIAALRSELNDFRTEIGTEISEIGTRLEEVENELKALLEA